MTLPSRPLYVPRTTLTSSSLRTGMERTWYLFRSSDESAELISTRRTDEGALKCALRDLFRFEDTAGSNFMAKTTRKERLPPPAF